MKAQKRMTGEMSPIKVNSLLFYPSTHERMKQEGVFASDIVDDNHETPSNLFYVLNVEFCFTVDVCAESKTAKCSKFYTVDDDGLAQSWSGERVFCNPPYGKEIAKWLQKSFNSNCELSVFLLPTYVESAWFQDLIIDRADEVRFIRGRLKFGNCRYIAPFSSMIVIYRRERLYDRTICGCYDLRISKKLPISLEDI